MEGEELNLIPQVSSPWQLVETEEKENGDNSNLDRQFERYSLGSKPSLFHILADSLGDNMRLLALSCAVAWILLAYFFLFHGSKFQFLLDTITPKSDLFS